MYSRESFYHLSSQPYPSRASLTVRILFLRYEIEKGLRAVYLFISNLICNCFKNGGQVFVAIKSAGIKTGK